MPNPVAAGLEFFAADQANLPAGTTSSVEFPSNANLGHVHIQWIWSGTPSDADNREDAALRVTVWAPKGQVTLAQEVAEGFRSRLLDWSSATVWRVNRGAGRLPGTDPDTQLPFCTFTVSAVMHALTP